MYVQTPPPLPACTQEQRIEEGHPVFTYRVGNQVVAMSRYESGNYDVYLFPPLRKVVSMATSQEASAYVSGNVCTLPK